MAWAPELVPVLGPDQLVSLRTGIVYDLVEIPRPRSSRSAQDLRITEQFREARRARLAAVAERRALRLVYLAFWSTKADGTARRGPVPVDRSSFTHARSSKDDSLRERRRINGPGMI